MPIAISEANSRLCVPQFLALRFLSHSGISAIGALSGQTAGSRLPWGPREEAQINTTMKRA